MSPKASNSRGASDMAEWIRGGVTLHDTAAAFGLSKLAARGRLNTGGWSWRTGQPLGAFGYDNSAPEHPHPTLAFIDQPWADQALCAQTDPEEFFPDKGGSSKIAKAVCAACPVQAECLDWALTTHEHFGIWGGLSERERRKLGVHIPCPPDSCDRMFDTAQGVRSHQTRVHKGFTPTPRKAIA